MCSWLALALDTGVVLEASADVGDYLHLILHCEVKFLKNLGLSPDRHCPRLVIKPVLE